MSILKLRSVKPFAELAKAACSCVLVVLSTTNSYAAPEFEPVRPGHIFQFPKDHGVHPEQETEWWYFTGHLEDDQKRTYGIELTFFRFGVQRTKTSSAPWEVDSLAMVHFALTDDQAQKFFHHEYLSRGAFNTAGFAKDSLNVWAGPFRAQLVGDEFRLTGSAQGHAVDLTLQSKKPPVLHGANGFSQKGPEVGEASLYSSLTRLVGQGSLDIRGERRTITDAKIWMDHEAMTTAVVAKEKGWDWFALQLEDGRDIMVYNLREDGKKTSFSSGSVVSEDGVVRHLAAEDFEIRPLETWKSPTTGKTYPSRWQLLIPSEHLDATVVPTVRDQELVTSGTTGVTYWEGRAVLEASSVKGNAYVELVGY